MLPVTAHVELLYDCITSALEECFMLAGFGLFVIFRISKMSCQNGEGTLASGMHGMLAPTTLCTISNKLQPRYSAHALLCWKGLT